MPQRLIALTVSVWLVAGVPAVAHAQVPDFEPVTAAELIDPAPGDWINWRRTLNGQGFSRVLPSSSVGEESLSPNHPDTSSRF